MASLVKDTLHVEHLQPAISALVADKSGGNPLYAIEICRSLLASGSIVVDRAAATATIGVPELAMVDMPSPSPSAHLSSLTFRPCTLHHSPFTLTLTHTHTLNPHTSP